MINALDITGIVIVFCAIVVSVVLHEMAHSATARYLGDDTAYEHGRNSINPLNHIDIFTTVLLPLGMILLHMPPFFIAKPVPVDSDNLRYGEFGMAIVAVAGPLTNLALAAATAIAIKQMDLSQSNLIGQAMNYFAQINVSLFVFNMIPFPPLDGSRLLYAFSPDFLRNILRQIESYGIMAIAVFILLVFPFLSSFVRMTSTRILDFLM